MNGLGIAIVSTSQRRDDRPQGARHRRRRRSALHRRLTAKDRGKTCPRIGKQSGSAAAQGRGRRSPPGEITVKGPLGTLTRAFGADRRRSRRTASTLVFKAADDAEAERDVRHAARAGRQHGQGRDQGLREEADAGRRRLPRAGRRATSSTCRSASRTRSCTTMPKGVKVETPTQTEIVVKGIDKQQVGQVAAEIRALPPARAVQGQGRALRRRAGRRSKKRRRSNGAARHA